MSDQKSGAALYESWLCARARGMTQTEHAESLGIPYGTYGSRLFRGRAEYLAGLPASFISASPSRKWDDNEELNGDALILSDVETPYHHADFMNKCIRLAKSWGIPNLVLAGDFVHFENFSA